MSEASRRDFLKIVGSGVVGLAIGVAGGYYAGLSAGGAAKTETTTKTGGGVPSKPFKIGIMYFMSGAFGTYGTMAKNAIDIAVEEINNAGGILGRKLEITVKDEAERQQVIDNITKMVQEEGAEVLMGIDSSGDALKLIDTIENKLKTILIVTHAATPKLTECGKRKYIFRISTYEEPIDIAAAKIIAERYPDVKKVTSIGPDYSYGWDSWAVFSSALKNFKPDVELIDPVYPKLGTTDYSDYIDRLISSGADMVFSSLWGGDAATFLKQAVAKGFFNKIKYYFNAMLGATDTLEAIGDENVPTNAEVWGSGRYWFLYPPHDIYPLNGKFVSKFKAKTGKYPPYVAGTSYTAIYALKKAIELAYAELGKWPDTEELIPFLEGLTVAGPMGTVYIRPEDHQGIYPVYWGKLSKGAPQYSFPILKDLVVYTPGQIIPPPGTTYVECPS